MTLFHLMLLLKDGRNVRLSYHSKEAAETQHTLIFAGAIPMLSAVDQYGKSFICSRDQVIGTELVDVTRDLEGMIEMQILQAHANAKLQKRAKIDPMLNGPNLAVPANLSGLQRKN